MFQRIMDMDWKIPTLSLVGVIVLLGGIYVGVKSIDEKTPAATNTIHTDLEKSEDAFYLNENCEVVINSVDKTTNETISTKAMNAPEELFNKTEEEIIQYIEETYPGMKIESITQGEILLKDDSPYKDLTKKNKYSIEVEHGIICIYKYDINGNRSLETETSQKIDLLPQKLQEEIQKGILADSIDEVDAILDSILS